MLVLGGMVAGPGLLAAWEVYGEHMHPKPDEDQPPTPEPAPSATDVVPEPVVVIETTELEGLRSKPKRRSRLEPEEPPTDRRAWYENRSDWEEDDEEEKTVLFKLNDVLSAEDLESILVDE